MNPAPSVRLSVCLSVTKNSINFPSLVFSETLHEVRPLKMQKKWRFSRKTLKFFFISNFSKSWFLAFFLVTRHYFWLKLHIQIVLNIIYNFSFDTMVGKTYLHPFFQQKRQFLIKKIHWKGLLLMGSNFQ